jgi:hypothetical protein
MTDQFEEGPDPNELRRHAKRMYTERQYREKYCRLDFYRPNRKQLEFHKTIADERLLRAGNQLGKTHSVGAELAMHSVQIYPEWFDGRKFLEKPRIERPFDFIGWAGSTTSLATRDGIQAKLLGDIRSEGGLAAGLSRSTTLLAAPRWHAVLPISSTRFRFDARAAAKQSLGLKRRSRSAGHGRASRWIAAG